MAVSLKKGERVSLEKRGGGGLTKVTMGLGWDPAKKSGGGFLGKVFGGGKPDSIDLDASCLAFSGKSLVDTVWFGQKKAFGGAIAHSGDNLTGEGEGDDESIYINLAALPANVDRLVLTVNSFRGQTFNEVDNAHCRVIDDASGNEIAAYKLAEKGAHTGVIMAILAKEGDAWSMRAVGEPADGRTAADMAGPAVRFF